MLLALGMTPNVVTAAARPSNSQSDQPTRHARARKRSQASPSSRVRNYKSDDEVTRRGRDYPRGTTSVIVTFVKGANLPAALKRYARGQKLDIINGQVLDLPNGLVKQLEAQPEVFRIHHNRATRQG